MEKVTRQKLENYSYKKFKIVSDKVHKQPLNNAYHLSSANKLKQIIPNGYTLPSKLRKISRLSRYNINRKYLKKKKKNFEIRHDKFTNAYFDDKVILGSNSLFKKLLAI